MHLGTMQMQREMVKKYKARATAAEHQVTQQQGQILSLENTVANLKTQLAVRACACVCVCATVWVWALKSPLS